MSAVGRAGVATARIVFLVRVAQDRTEDFLAAYEQIRYEVADGVPGHLRDQLCRSTDDPEQWLITSEWTDLAAFVAWETSPDHVALVRPLRECFTQARSLRFEVLAETSRSTPGPGRTDVATDPSPTDPSPIDAAPLDPSPIDAAPLGAR